MSGITLDAGALIAFERADRHVVNTLRKALITGTAVAIPAGVIAQVWRGGSRQARLARLLRSPDLEIEALDDHLARAAGQLCGATGTTDVVDASVIVCARAKGHSVMTSDPVDLRRLDASLKLEVV